MVAGQNPTWLISLALTCTSHFACDAIFLFPSAAAGIDSNFAGRWESLLSVNDHVQRIFDVREELADWLGHECLDDGLYLILL